MVRQAFDLLDHPVRRQRLQGLDNTGMQHPPPLLEQAAVGHLMRQGMLERVRALREEARLVEKLGGLQVGKTALECILGRLGNRLQQRQGHLGANHGSRLQEAFVLWRQSVDARRQDRLHCGGDLQGRQRLHQTVRPGFAYQHPGLHQRAYALLQEERVALGARNEQGYE
jgi:hypothetical protein